MTRATRAAAWGRMVAVSRFPAASRLRPREPVLGDRRELSEFPATSPPASSSSGSPPTSQRPSTTPPAATAPPTTPAPPPATSSPAVQAAAATVKLSVTLPVSRAAFNASAQQAFKEAMAVAAGLARADAGRVALVVRDLGRRLLASGVGVDVTIGMPDAAAARLAASSLTAERINAELVKAGLPAATITSAPAVSAPAGSAAAAAGGGRAALAWAALVAAAAVCAAA